MNTALWLCALLAPAVAEAPFAVEEGGPRLVGRVLGDSGPAVLVPYDAGLHRALAPLARGRRIILYDMRGRGRSAPVADPEALGIDRDVEDLERVRRHHRLERVSLVGLSYLGAMVGLYAAEHPDRVERVPMLGPLAPTTRVAISGLRAQPGADGLERLAARRAKGDEVSDPRGFCEAWWDVHLPLHAGGDTVAEALRTAIAGTCALENEQPARMLPTIGGVFARYRDWDFTAAAARIRAPLLVVHGDRDKVAPVAGGAAWVDLAPEARLLSVPGAGHGAFAERPDIVLPALDLFLGGSWPADARR